MIFAYSFRSGISLGKCLFLQLFYCIFSAMIRIPFNEIKQEFKRILLKLSFPESKAECCAGIFADNSLDGVYSHGLNRFPAFVEYVKKGIIDVKAEPELVQRNGLVEIWDGHSGPGMYNATLCMKHAIELAKTNGIGCVALFRNNHWMRGGTYGWQAANSGCIGICFTNAGAGMAPWGGTQPRLGNNPLVIAVPGKDGPVVLDMALSQYSYGKMQEYQMVNKRLPFPGGYDEAGRLTTNPEVIRQTNRALPIGLWKGSGLALLLDMVLTAITGGKSTAKITAEKIEASVTQCFLCLYQENFHPELIEEIIAYTKTSKPTEPGDEITYPGERTMKRRAENLRDGIPVNEEIWKEVKRM